MSKKISHKEKKIDIYIGPESSIIGNIITEKSVSIDGHVDGDVTSKGEIIIGKHAHITGNVKGYSITASGYVKGNIDANDFIKLTTSCKVEGDICAKSFIADEGAMFNGVCNMFKRDESKESNS